MKRHAMFVLGALFVCASISAQGPGSCGFHLDVRANLTSSHSAIADTPGAPGAFPPFFPIGAPGSPYTAYATPGSPMAIVVSGEALDYGPFPLGAGSCVSLFYSPAPFMVPVGLGPPFVPSCTGAPFCVGILPYPPLPIFDSCGFISAPPPFGFYDGGSGHLQFNGTYPVFAPPVLALQAVGQTPGGAVWVTNPVVVIAGPNPAELPVVGFAVCGAFPIPDESQSVGNPVPPGFAFYGVGVPSVDVDINGFLDFVPGVGAGIAGGCDFTGAVGDLGCAVASAQARPRIDVDHADFDFGVVLAAPFFPLITMEFRPPSAGSPDAVIYRWKNAPPLGGVAPFPGLSTSDFCVELQGGAYAGPPNRIVVVRSYLAVVDQVGIGPGLAVHGFGGPPPAGAPSTCALGAAGLSMIATFAPPLGLPYAGGPFGAIHMDSAAFSAFVLNSAIVFTPVGAGYTCTVY